MKLLKSLLIIGTVNLSLILLNACCDSGFSYQWQDIFIDVLSNNEPAGNTTIKQSELGMKVNLANIKSAKALLPFPKPYQQAYAAFDCWTTYRNVDTISKINVLFLIPDGNTERPQAVTSRFIAKTDIYSPDEIMMHEIVNVLNDAKQHVPEYFYLTLSDPFEDNVTGRFVVNIYLTDNRLLSDTTETLSLNL